MSKRARAGSIGEQIESLRSRQEHHEQLARKHREAALRFWRQRAVLELSVAEGLESGAPSEKTRRKRADGR
jgi:hypothetical protein